MEEKTTESPPAKLQLFGFEPGHADIEVVHRPRSWRLTHALAALGIALAVASVVWIIPPHIPWPLIALGTGIYLAYKYWTTEYTITSFSGECPKCGAEQMIESDTKLDAPHTLTCGECQRDLMLHVDVREE